MVQNSLGSTVRCILLVCSLFLMFSQQPHAEQHAILVGVWDYENPNLQLDAPSNDLKLMEAVLSAHGVAQGRYPDRNDEALLPVDANLASPKTYLLDDELNTLLQELPTRQVSCIIDTCYSGDILREIRLGQPKGTPATDTPMGIAQPTHFGYGLGHVYRRDDTTARVWPGFFAGVQF